jgi:nucleotide-binding universal stress UspA family protein
MKIICAVDASDECIKSLELCVRLAFPSPSFELVHVIERLAPLVYGEYSGSTDLIDQVMKTQRDMGRESLLKGQDVLKGFLGEKRAPVTSVTPHLLEGFIARELSELAKTTNADLISLGHIERSRLEGIFYGGVGRKLAVVSPCSILIARDKPVKKAGFHAVFATDHSDYANQCFDYFLARFPTGIEKLTVMSSYSPVASAIVSASARNSWEKAGEWIEAGLERENQKIKKKLVSTAAGESVVVDTLVLAATPQDAIEKAMQQANADLLILGAQGHGFMQRFMMGSVSFYQATEGRYHTMIVRV